LGRKEAVMLMMDLMVVHHERFKTAIIEEMLESQKETNDALEVIRSKK
jgi:hypothetical protein